MFIFVVCSFAVLAYVLVILADKRTESLDLFDVDGDAPDEELANLGSGVDEYDSPLPTYVSHPDAPAGDLDLPVSRAAN